MSDAQPLYAKVKDHILDNIRSGAWEAGRRVPSENELVESFGISRMTANRALRELTSEGFLSRVPGVGTFVKEAPALSSLMELRNIAEEIAQRGHRYSSRLIRKGVIDSNPALAEEFEDRGIKQLFHIVIVHEENGVPVQLEDRHVNPAVAPNFLEHDFTETTPTAVLLAATPSTSLSTRWKPPCPRRSSSVSWASPHLSPVWHSTDAHGAAERSPPSSHSPIPPAAMRFTAATAPARAAPFLNRSHS